VGGRSLDEDIAAVRGVADALGSGVRLAVDANRSWTRRDALMVSLACRDLLFVMEQPCDTYEEILAVRRQIPHPIYLDESAEDLGVILRAIGDGAADGFGLKLTRVGGISAMRTIRDVCHAAGLPITCDDSWGGDIIAAACLHVGATVTPELSEGVWIAAPYIAAHYDPENGLEPKGGHLTLPPGPGLGVTPDTEQFGRPVMSFG
jgi:L-alanine-DL-glutamate epimerase-like enolase superfamily enzyme